MSKDIHKPEQLITEHIDIWTSAILAKSTSGRGSSKKYELYGITKLRGLIFDLAVRGKLVPQDLDDEPASKLIERVVTRKFSEITENEKIFTLPLGWSWIKLEDIAEINGGFAFKSSDYTSDGIRVIRISDFNEMGFKSDKVVRYPYSLDLERYRLEENNILMAMTGGTVGKSLLVQALPEPMIVNQRVATIKLIQGINSTYINSLIRSELIQSVINEAKNSTNDNISMKSIKNFLIPLPPFAEQKRIVAKVDELMLLCDQLEQQTEASIDAHATLVDVLLSTLTDSADADELAQNWARIAEHFDNLFTTEQSIEALKQTVLQLAVMGKLVQQDPNDEPASVLLEKIAKEKEQLVKEGDIKKTKPLPELTDDEKPFESPTGWEFYRLGNLIKKLGSGSTPRGGQNAYVSEGIPFLRSQNVWNEGLNNDDIAYITSETHQRMSNTVVYPGDILLNITGASLGRSIVFPDTYLEANVSQHVTIIRLIDHSMTPFIYLCIRSPLLQKIVWERQVGMAIEGLSKKVLELFEIPIPPLSEQQRIVAKVEELMAICDQLKEKLQQSQKTQVQLTDALVDRALG